MCVCGGGVVGWSFGESLGVELGMVGGVLVKLCIFGNLRVCVSKYIQCWVNVGH